MNSATKTAVDPIIFVVNFTDYAKATGTECTTDNIQAWDTKYNHSKMRTAIIARYGEGVLIEVAIKEMFKRYLYRGTMLHIVASKKNPEPFKIENFATSGIYKGTILLDCNEEQLSYLVSAQKETIRNAVRKLKLLGLSLPQIQELVQEACQRSGF